MLAKELLPKLMEYSIVVPTAGRNEISQACSLAKTRHFACVSVFPCWVPFAARQLAGTDVKCSATIGYPYGVDALSVKVYSAQLLTKVGAGEIEVFVNISALKSGDFDVVVAEAEELKDTVTVTGLTHSGEEGMLKIAIPVDYLEPAELARLVTTLREVSVDFLTLFFQQAELEPISDALRLVRDCVGAEMGVKLMAPKMEAEMALRLADLGTNRVGCSNFADFMEKAEEATSK